MLGHNETQQIVRLHSIKPWTWRGYVFMLAIFVLITLLGALLFYLGGMTFLPWYHKLAFMVLLGVTDMAIVSYCLWSDATPFRVKVGLALMTIGALIALSVSLAWLVSGAPLWTMALAAVGTGLFSLVNMVYGGKRFLQLSDRKQWLSKAVVLALLCLGLVIFTMATHGVGVLFLPKAFVPWLAWSPRNFQLAIIATVGAFVGAVVCANRFYLASKPKEVEVAVVNGAADNDGSPGDVGQRPRAASRASSYVSEDFGTPTESPRGSQSDLTAVGGQRPRAPSCASSCGSDAFGTPGSTPHGSRPDLHTLGGGSDGGGSGVSARAIADQLCAYWQGLGSTIGIDAGSLGHGACGEGAPLAPHPLRRSVSDGDLRGHPAAKDSPLRNELNHRLFGQAPEGGQGSFKRWGSKRSIGSGESDEFYDAVYE